MADPEHLEILEQDVGKWNEWREVNRLVVSPDLSGANLGGADLREANLLDANLRSGLTDWNAGP